MVKTLLELGADLHCRDRKGRSGNQTEQQHFRDTHLNTFVPSEDRSLWMASGFVVFHTSGFLGGFRWLVSHLSSSLHAALHLASIGQRARTAEVLLELGLEDSEDCGGTTAQHLARTPDVVRVFEQCLK